MSHDVARLFAKVGVLAIPLVLVNAFYVTRDPFRVLYHHDPLHEPGSHVVVNRDFTSTQRLVDTLAARRYDAFILGNSRTLAFRCADWVPKIGARRPFHFDASNESLYGIWGKLRLLDRLGADIRDVLLVFDVETLGTVTDSAGHLFAKHPLVSGVSWFDYELMFYRAFFSSGFYWKYTVLLARGKFRLYMWDVLDPRVITILPDTNDLIISSQEDESEQDGRGAGARSGSAASRTSPPAAEIPTAPVIGREQRQMLTDVRDLLVRHGARWRVVISPVLDQRPLAAADVAVLRGIFGPRTVHDFSGKNAITEDEGNYYDPVHYRPHVGRMILEQVYTPE